MQAPLCSLPLKEKIKAAYTYPPCCSIRTRMNAFRSTWHYDRRSMKDLLVRDVTSKTLMKRSKESGTCVINTRHFSHLPKKKKILEIGYFFWYKFGVSSALYPPSPPHVLHRSSFSPPSFSSTSPHPLTYCLLVFLSSCLLDSFPHFSCTLTFVSLNASP